MKMQKAWDRNGNVFPYLVPAHYFDHPVLKTMYFPTPKPAVVPPVTEEEKPVAKTPEAKKEANHAHTG